MNDDELIEYLLGEIRELLSVGRVGLYEFPESLVYGHHDLPWSAQIRISKAALKVLLDAGEAHLAWEVWARHELTQDASGISVPDSAWEPLSEDPADLHKPYLAIEPIDNEAPRRGLFGRTKRSRP